MDRKVTFEELANKGYIPFTPRELLKQEPIEPGEAWLGKGKLRIENSQDITIQELVTYSLETNYAVCTFEFQVKDPDGKLLYEWDPRFMTSPTTYSVQLSNIPLEEQVAPYADGKNTIHVNVRLANGEFLEAVNTLLKIA